MPLVQLVEGLDAFEDGAFQLAPPARIDKGITVIVNAIGGMRDGRGRGEAMDRISRAA